MSTSTLQISRLSKLQRQIFICVSDKNKCAKRATQDKSWKYLKKRVRDLKLINCIGRTRANCFQHTCTAPGPIACVYCSRGATWYQKCTPEVLEDIIQEHLIKGNVVEKHFLVANDTVLQDGPIACPVPPEA